MDPNCAEDLPFENRTAAGAMLGRHLFGRCWPASTLVLGLPRGEQAARTVAATLRLPFEVLRRDSALPPLEGRTVIVVDDGMATGATMRAALDFVRSLQAARVIAAVPVGSRRAAEELARHADELVCLYCPEPFQGVGMYYAECARPKRPDWRHAA